MYSWSGPLTTSSVLPWLSWEGERGEMCVVHTSGAVGRTGNPWPSRRSWRLSPRGNARYTPSISVRARPHRTRHAAHCSPSGPSASLPCVRFVPGEQLDFHLPERYTPKNWLSNKFSGEMWLQRALRSHPWRSETAASADLVVLAANFSMYCRANKMFSGRNLWSKMNAALGMPSKGLTPQLHPSLQGSQRVPKAYVLTDNECMPPWTGTKRHKGLIELTDQSPHVNDILAPFVLTKPWWLVGAARTPSDAPAPEEVPWSRRRLLFFAGHVPKL